MLDSDGPFNRKGECQAQPCPEPPAPLPSAPFHKILVPTMDTVRYNHLVTALLSAQSPVLLVGPVGTGKTSIAQGVLQGLDRTAWAVLTVNMSAQVPAGPRSLGCPGLPGTETGGGRGPGGRVSCCLAGQEWRGESRGSG